jgi:hypothetical protein
VVIGSIILPSLPLSVFVVNKRNIHLSIYPSIMFDSFQAQQRAQKDQERKAKTEATAALQGYRRSGLSEEETKLAALREQERLQRLNAEQQLRGYRGQLSEADAKLAAQRLEELRKRQEYEEQLRNNGVVTSSQDNTLYNNSAENSGNVSALAAGYSSPNKVQQLPMPTVTKASPGQPDLSPTATTTTSNPSPIVATDGILNPIDSIPAVAPATVTGEGLLVDTPAETSQVEPSTNTTATTESAPSPPAPAAPSSKVYQSSVKFMFGIITAGGDDSVSFPQNRSQLIEGYLARADQIAKSVIADNNFSWSSFESILLSMAYPTASSVKKDESKYYTITSS